MRENQIEPGFYTPQSYCTFVLESHMADATIYLLSVTMIQAEAVKVFQLARAEGRRKTGFSLWYSLAICKP
jgi:hypothetical protein